jgi:hypothetical protein
LSSALGQAKTELIRASAQIVSLHHTRYDLEDRVTELLRERQEDQERLKTIMAWLETLQGAVQMETSSGSLSSKSLASGTGDFALNFDQHFGKQVLAKNGKAVSACFGGWCHCSWKKKRERFGLTRCARRVERKQLLAAFMSIIAHDYRRL